MGSKRYQAEIKGTNENLYWWEKNILSYLESYELKQESLDLKISLYLVNPPHPLSSEVVPWGVRNLLVVLFILSVRVTGVSCTKYTYIEIHNMTIEQTKKIFQMVIKNFPRIL